MTRVTFLAAVGAVALAGCSIASSGDEAALKAQYDPVTTRDAFVSKAAGRPWQSDEVVVRFSGDGSLSGSVNGVPVTGEWTWQGSQFCTTFRVGDSGGDGCSEVRIRPDELLIVPRDGTGAPVVYRTPENRESVLNQFL